VARPLFKSALGFLDPAQYNGASMLGLRGVVVKSHGSADSAGFGHALTVALAEARGGLPDRIAARLAAVTSGH
jgi:glycerol-3-phosphate acyltransferase PlsX